jgi:hypothetical protein
VASAGAVHHKQVLLFLQRGVIGQHVQPHPVTIHGLQVNGLPLPLPFPTPTHPLPTWPRQCHCTVMSVHTWEAVPVHGPMPHPCVHVCHGGLVVSTMLYLLHFGMCWSPALPAFLLVQHQFVDRTGCYTSRHADKADGNPRLGMNSNC